MFEVHATNDITSTLIAKKYTLEGALGLATQLLESWDDVTVRERKSETDETFKIVAHLSAKGLFV